ncbi:MAG: glutamine amidotransferase [Candidatus Ancillula trichonymphae]|jgi:CobQ-like glutamine amidotransferase family enzyme|nr:glutamine amidotransferase [Candidatus Ancillula trichonymphae]
MSIFTEEFNILELYTKQMNIYGDTGNSQILKKRMELYSLKSNILHYNIGDVFPTKVDIIVSGGGQDSSQMRVAEDLLSIKDHLKLHALNSTPMLVVCGMYQLFGNYFETSTGEKISGLSILDAHTVAQDKRLIGNVIASSNAFGTLVGYENHSGQTTLVAKATALAEQVSLGYGNDATSQTEGIIYKNVIGTYLHGPVLSKNPKLADYLINCAVTKRMGYEVQLTSNSVAKLDELVEQARKVAQKLRR